MKEGNRCICHYNSPIRDSAVPGHVVIRSINHGKAQAVVLLVPTPTNLITQSMLTTYKQPWGAYGLLQHQNLTVS